MGLVSVLLVCALAAGAIVGLAWWRTPPAANVGPLVHERLAATDGRFVSLSDVAPVMREAVVAAEDERFYRHHGIDSLGLARALAYDVSHLSIQQGASTITEQLAKVLYLNGNDHSLWRKVEDAVLAAKIERHATKEQVLEAYLNTVYFGNRDSGIRQASEGYFGVPPSALTLAQASMLAGTIQAPSLFDPFTDPAMARQRQAEVLEAMVRNGFITETEAYGAVRARLPLTGGRAVPADADAQLVFPSLLAVPVLLVGLGAIAAACALLLLRRRWRPLVWIGAGLFAVGLLVVARSLHAA